LPERWVLESGENEMKQLLILAGAIAFTATAPAYAKPGNWHGNPHAYGYAYGHGHGNTGYGVGGCPPGLRDKGCMPPGQAKKMFRTGQRFNTAYGSRYAYGQIPRSIRNQYGLSGRYQYYYDNGYLYQVNPRTMLVQQVISALLGRY
jgi:hypothetical protein